MSRNFSGLLDKLVSKHGVADLDSVGFQAFMDAPGNAPNDAIVLFTEEPDKVAESWDLAVIFPDLIKATGKKARLALLRPEVAGDFLGRFAIKRLPALLFLRDGAYVGVIEGLRDWNEFVSECNTMLQQPVSRIPGIGVAVTTASSACH